jgi:hypothetical protein
VFKGAYTADASPPAAATRFACSLATNSVDTVINEREKRKLQMRKVMCIHSRGVATGGRNELCMLVGNELGGYCYKEKRKENERCKEVK